MTREFRRKGFTLVELLIVIVIIGILSAMMMISSGEAVSSAKAAGIVNNLRAVKIAALSYYEEHSDTAGAITKDDLSNANLLKYLQKTNDGGNQDKEALKVFEAYGVVIDDWGDWYARCDITKIVGTENASNTERKALLRKLDGKSRSQGISFSDKDNGSARTQDVKNQRYIYMWIR